MMEGSMIDQYEDDDPGEGSSISPKKRMEDLMNGGKEDYTAGYFESAAMKFAEALMLSKKGYGELAAECFEPSFFYAKTMLDWARCMSNTSRETELAQVLLEEFHERLMEAGTRFQTDFQEPGGSMMEGSMIDQYEDDDPGEGSSISPKKRMEDLMNGGKEDYTAGYFESAAMKFAEALMLSKKGYGELAAECFEPSFFYAKTMLDWARCMSNTSRETELAQVLLEEFHERLMEAGTRFQTEEKSREVHDDTSKTHGESDETMKSSDVDLKPMEKMTNGNSKTSAKEENEQAKVEEKGELSGGRAEGASKLASKTLDEKNIEMRKKLPDPHRGEENLNEDDNKFVKVDDGGGEKSGGRVAAKNEEDEFENVSKVLSGLDYNVKTVAGLKKRAPAPNDFSGCAEHARTDGSMNYMKETNEIGGNVYLTTDCRLAVFDVSNQTSFDRAGSIFSSSSFTVHALFLCIDVCSFLCCLLF
ncbi:hypothetical protein Tcan_08965 [Toxocara canis]|uniref:Uncharacterized protein n=1 Tax=Toxocara canis TaxID=6265 RepID=A0A0B2VT68_TOXCA|nr:hypothetical protein Tcan_08965 [Toxocara canis]